MHTERETPHLVTDVGITVVHAAENYLLISHSRGAYRGMLGQHDETPMIDVMVEPDAGARPADASTVQPSPDVSAGATWEQVDLMQLPAASPASPETLEPLWSDVERVQRMLPTRAEFESYISDASANLRRDLAKDARLAAASALGTGAELGPGARAFVERFDRHRRLRLLEPAATAQQPRATAQREPLEDVSPAPFSLGPAIARSTRPASGLVTSCSPLDSPGSAHATDLPEASAGPVAPRSPGSAHATDLPEASAGPVAPRSPRLARATDSTKASAGPVAAVLLGGATPHPSIAGAGGSGAGLAFTSGDADPLAELDGRLTGKTSDVQIAHTVLEASVDSKLTSVDSKLAGTNAQLADIRNMLSRLVHSVGGAAPPTEPPVSAEPSAPGSAEPPALRPSGLARATAPTEAPAGPVIARSPKPAPPSLSRRELNLQTKQQQLEVREQRLQQSEQDLRRDRAQWQLDLRSATEQLQHECALREGVERERDALANEAEKCVGEYENLIMDYNKLTEQLRHARTLQESLERERDELADLADKAEKGVDRPYRHILWRKQPVEDIMAFIPDPDSDDLCDYCWRTLRMLHSDGASRLQYLLRDPQPVTTIMQAVLRKFQQAHHSIGDICVVATEVIDCDEVAISNCRRDPANPDNQKIVYDIIATQMLNMRAAYSCTGPLGMMSSEGSALKRCILEELGVGRGEHEYLEEVHARFRMYRELWGRTVFKRIAASGELDTMLPSLVSKLQHRTQLDVFQYWEGLFADVNVWVARGEAPPDFAKDWRGLVEFQGACVAGATPSYAAFSPWLGDDRALAMLKGAQHRDDRMAKISVPDDLHFVARTGLLALGWDGMISRILGAARASRCVDTL